MGKVKEFIRGRWDALNRLRMQAIRPRPDSARCAAGHGGGRGGAVRCSANWGSLPSRGAPAQGRLAHVVQHALTHGPVHLTVRGSSMAPTVKEGEVLTVGPVRRVWPGDLVVFPGRGGALVAHRVVALWPRGGTWWLLTQGDACRRPDGWLAGSALVGVVTPGSARARWKGRWLASAGLCRHLARRVRHAV